MKGRVWKYGNNINTDVIVPARYLNTMDPKELAKHCMEDLDGGFAKKVQKGDIIVAGENFGCGSSREHAPIAIKNCGISSVIAKSFARIFFRNAINIGLPVFELPEAAEKIKDHDVIEIKDGVIQDLSSGEIFHVKPFPEFIQEIISAGGLIKYTQRILK